MIKSGRVWTVLSMLEWTTGYFKNKNIPDPRLSIEWILAEVLHCKRLDLYLQFERPLSSEELDKIRPLVKRRALHEPLQYITGSTQFLNATISVTPDVLIPRIETEQLVDLMLDHFKEKKDDPLNLLDIGTGSGCIPVAVKKENPAWYCAGFDVSPKALEIATKNAEINDVNVDFFEANILDINRLPSEFQKPWDIIISNPPYITEAEKEELLPQVLKYEPIPALFHDKPMLLYEKIIKFAASKKASLYLECNDKTAANIQKLAGKHFLSVELLKDLDHNGRFVVASSHSKNKVV